MSKVEPFGTWQYAHAVCLPAGARAGRTGSAGRAGRTAAQRARLAPAQLRGRDLVEGAAHVHGRRASAFVGAPRDRSGERPVELEHARPGAVALEVAAVGGGEPRPRQIEQVARRHVEQHGTCLAELGRATRPRGRSRSGRRARGGRTRARRRSAASPRGAIGQPTACASTPSVRPNAALGRAVQRQHRVRGEAGEDAARPLAAERDTAGGARRAARPAPRPGDRARAGARTQSAAPGAGGSGTDSTGSISGQARTSGPTSSGDTRARRRRAPAAVPSRSGARPPTAVPSSSGCAHGAGRVHPVDRGREIGRQLQPVLRPAGARPSRGRGRSPAASAPRCASRRRSAVAASSTRTSALPRAPA